MNQFDIGIDMGTNSVIVYMKDKGIVLEEPSLVAFDENKDEVIAVGQKAFEMLGKTPSNISLIEPLQNGSISDFRFAEEMLKTFLKKVFGNLFFKPSICMCVPCSITNLEKNVFVNTALNVGARKVSLIEEPLAAAIGCGIDIAKSEGNMVVDVGAGSTDIAVVSLGGIVKSKSIKTAGYSMDEHIIEHINRRKGLLIGRKTAERIKKEIGTLFEPDKEIMTEVKGMLLSKGLPGKARVNQKEIYEAILPDAKAIVDAIHSVIEVTPPELTGDIIDLGIKLTGGVSLLNGFDKYISRAIGVNVRVMEDPIHCVAKGTGLCLNYLDSLVDSDYSEREF